MIGSGVAWDLVLNAVRQAWLPPPRLTVSEWADANRILTQETSSEHGQWRTARFPFLREIMDSLSALDPCERVAWMKGAQVGATEAGLNWIGYSIEHDPGPMLLVVPDFGFAKRYSKRRITPMIKASPALRALVSPSRSRDSGNTILQKEFPGGVLAIASSESEASLSSDPVRRVMMDEADRFDRGASVHGTPIAQAEVRTTNFSNRKIYFPSTPRLRETSYIEPLFLEGDMRRYYVPCPHCQHWDFITWRGPDPFGVAPGIEKIEGGEATFSLTGKHFAIVWSEDKPETAALSCPKCGVDIEERYKTWMLAKGEWRATSTGDGITKSYHLPSMYSPAGFLSWKKMVREWLKAVAHQRRGDNTLMIDFINLRLGEAWEEVGEMIKKEGLLARAESIDNAPAFGPRKIAEGVGVLVASVDVQGDRLESLVVGFGRDEESWDIEWRQFQGDPDNDDLWMELDRYLQRDWIHASGRKMPIECVTIDSGGHHTEKVYAFCKPRIDRRVFAVKGGTELARPLVEKPSRKNRYRTPLFTLCVDTGKDRIYSRLKIDRPGPGYIHFPAAHWFDEEFVAQLTAERKIPKWLKGKGAVPYWKKIRDRNEALDLSVYALAALYILDGGLGFIDTLPEEAERWATKAEGGTEEVAEDGPRALQQETLVQPVRLQRGWVNSWRGSR